MLVYPFPPEVSAILSFLRSGDQIQEAKEVQRDKEADSEEEL
jgi:hypothetical protein